MAALDQTQQTSYSPVIRRCMSTFESKLEERINAAVQDITCKLMEGSVLGKRTSSLMPGQIGLETKRRRTRNSHLVDELQPGNPFDLENDATFKVPNEVVGGRESVWVEDSIRAANPMNSTFDLHENTAQEVVSNGQGNRTAVRRSRRVQELNESKLQLKLVEEAVKQPEVKRKSRKNPSFVRNPYLASYFRLSTQLESPEEEVGGCVKEETEQKKRGGRKQKVTKNSHADEVLKILNGGNLKELQILPQVGLKTAYQIMTYRATKGKFKSFKDLAKLNWTEKKVERFMKVSVWVDEKEFNSND